MTHFTQTQTQNKTKTTASNPKYKPLLIASFGLLLCACSQPESTQQQTAHNQNSVEDRTAINTANTANTANTTTNINASSNSQDSTVAVSPAEQTPNTGSTTAKPSHPAPASTVEQGNTIEQSNQAKLDKPVKLDSHALPDRDIAVQGTQVTQVNYVSSSGNRNETIQVTYETSPTGKLSAKVRLPSGSSIVLTAPAGQGNNPSYRSADGKIELVSHGGGGSVDLLMQDKITSFDATGAEAEVIKN